MKYTYALKEARITGRPPRSRCTPNNTKEDFERASVGIVGSRGRHGRIKNLVTDRVYLVLEDEGEFRFGGEEGQEEKSYPVSKDDVLLIPKGTVYDYEGHMRLFLAHGPAYEQESDVHYDDLWE